MRSSTFERVGRAGSDDDDLLTTGQAAEVLSSSRQHVVDLCDRGDLAFTTTGVHRRVRRSDVEALRTRTDQLTRDQERSLWLAHAVAGAIVFDPTATIDLARQNLKRLQEQHTRGQLARWLGEWQVLLDGPIEDLLATLTSRTPRARELRQNNPFAGVLSDEQRVAVLRAHSSTHRSRS
jgi:excisionase family DNA binding protein